MTLKFHDIDSLLEKSKQVSPVELDMVRNLPVDHPIFQLADEQPRVPAFIPKGASFKHFTPEERTMVASLLQRNPDAGYLVKEGKAVPIFTPRYPFQLNGQPDEVTRRRVYHTVLESCPQHGCDGQHAWWIDRYYLTLGTFCPSCHADTIHDSWAEYQWRRRPLNAIISEHDTFIANDPLLKDEDLWIENRLFHLGSGMRTGKTTFLFLKADALVRNVPDSRVIYLGARVSQVRGIYAENCGSTYGTDNPKWGLFYEGSSAQDKVIGTHGAIATISSLQLVLKKFETAGIPPDMMHIVIDEVDFGASLMNASIMKDLKVENKGILQNAVSTNGIVVAGQTENLLALEGFALELGIPPSGITGYYKRGNMENSLVTIVDYPQTEGKKALQIAVVIERCKQLIQEGKRPYVFCQGRRTAQIIASQFQDVLIYDAYERGSALNEALLFNQRAPIKTRIVVASCAIDVGISIKDEHAYCITVVDQNIRYLNGVASPTQQVVRDRNPSNREVHLLNYDNRLPVSPSFLKKTGVQNMEAMLKDSEVTLTQETLDRLESIEMTDKEIQEVKDAKRNAEVLVVNHLSTRKALDELSDFQLRRYLTYQMDYAGFNVEITSPAEPDESTIQAVRDVKKEIVETEKEAVETRAKAILNGEPTAWTVSEHGVQTPGHESTLREGNELTDYNDPMSSDDIRRAGSRYLLKPAPYEQLSHEKAWEACAAVGFRPVSHYELHTETQLGEDYLDAPIDETPEDTGTAVFMTSRQLNAAVQFVVHRLDFSEFSPQKLGYLAVHHEQVIRNIFEKEQGETTHRVDYRRIGYVLQKLLYHLPLDRNITEIEFCTAVHNMMEEYYGDRQLLDMLTDGSIGTTNATKLRFYLHNEPLARVVGKDMDAEELSENGERLCTWALEFLVNHYPCQIARRGGHLRIRRAKHWDIMMECVECDLLWGLQASTTEREMKRSELIPQGINELDFHPHVREPARALRNAGMTIDDIATELNTSPHIVRERVQDITPPKPETLDQFVLKRMKPGVEYSKATLSTKLGDSAPKNLSRIFGILLKKGQVQKTGYGKYKRIA